VERFGNFGIGYGETTSEATLSKAFTLADGRRLANVDLRDRTIIDLADGEGEDSRDYSVSIRWVKTYERQDAKTFPGIFSFPGVVCRLTDKDTLLFLNRHFNSPIDMTGEAFEPHVWIEKTILAGRPDRQEGEFALVATCAERIEAISGSETLTWSSTEKNTERGVA